MWNEEGPVLEYKIIDMIGFESVSDGEKDVLKRGGGVDNMLYVNRLADDFDTVDNKADKGDILYADEIDPAKEINQD